MAQDGVELPKVAPGRRSYTINFKRESVEHRVELRVLMGNVEHDRPRTRAECASGPRPCPYVGCRHHLYLDVKRATGHVTLNFPELEPWEMSESCALDVAENGGSTLEEIAQAMHVTRERVRQLEGIAVRKLLRASDPRLREMLREHWEDL